MSIPVRRLAILIGVITLPTLAILLTLGLTRSPGAPAVGEREPVRVGAPTGEAGTLNHNPHGTPAADTTALPSDDEGAAPGQQNQRPQAEPQVPGFRPNPPPPPVNRNSGSGSVSSGSGAARPTTRATRQVLPPVQTRPAPPPVYDDDDWDDDDWDDDDWDDDDWDDDDDDDDDD